MSSRRIKFSLGPRSITFMLENHERYGKDYSFSTFSGGEILNGETAVNLPWDTPLSRIKFKRGYSTYSIVASQRRFLESLGVENLSQLFSWLKKSGGTSWQAAPSRCSEEVSVVQAFADSIKELPDVEEFEFRRSIGLNSPITYLLVEGVPEGVDLSSLVSPEALDKITTKLSNIHIRELAPLIEEELKERLNKKKKEVKETLSILESIRG